MNEFCKSVFDGGFIRELRSQHKRFLLQHAEEAVKEGKRNRAIMMFKSLLLLDPQNERAMKYVGKEQYSKMVHELKRLFKSKLKKRKHGNHLK